MLYGSVFIGENKTEKSMSVTKIRLLKWISGVTREDKIRTTLIVRGNIGIVSILDNMKDKQ